MPQPRRTSTCQQPSLSRVEPLHLSPQKPRGTEVANPLKTKDLTVFSAAGWLYRNNLAGECWLCLRSADSCRAPLPFSFFFGGEINVFLYLDCFCCAQQFSQDIHQRDIFWDVFFLSLLPGARCAKPSSHIQSGTRSAVWASSPHTSRKAETKTEHLCIVIAAIVKRLLEKLVCQ